MEEWKKKKISEITIMKNGKKRPNTNGSYPVYGGNGIIDYTANYNDENNIIIGRVGAYCGCVYRCEEKCWVSDNAISVKANNDADTDYLYYLLVGMDLNHHHIGGAQPLMTQDIINRLEVCVPDITEQILISSLLKILDNKITLNTRINDNLEQQAQALYRSWFVDFEPFKGGKFVDSELGEIPEGWRVCTLSQVTENIRQKVGNNKYKVLSPITKGELVLSEDYFTKQVYSEDISKYITVSPNCIAYNPARVNIGSIGINKFDFIGCVSPVYVVVKIDTRFNHFFDCFIKSNSFKEEVKTRAIGGVRQTLFYDDFGLIKIVYPPKNVICEFNLSYDLFIELQNKNSTENENLSSLRDSLLPKLMSGELKITE